MLNVACVKVGTRYGADYVNILLDMVRRNLPAGFVGRFVCFTDDATGLDPLIEVREVPKDLADRGWWAKLFLFSKGAFPQGERVLYFDLDTVICGPLDAIAAYKGPFAILRDAYRKDGLQSSVMAWEAGKLTHLWEDWKEEDIDGGDQAWIERYGAAAILQDVFPEKFRSYKVECRSHIPRGTSVVFFHGHPRPHEATGWVPLVWKIGGGSGTEWIVSANVSRDELFTNVRSAMERDCEWLSEKPANRLPAIVVGGGPSLRDTAYYIRGMQLAGARVYATGNAFAYLVSLGITPDAHVLLDARPENLSFVPSQDCPKYYASQCHPSTLDAAGDELVCWHAAQTSYETLIQYHDGARVGGGTTVGLKAVAIAYILGHRDIRLFGFDSSYADSHHAYPQALNDNERVVEATIAGETFRAAPWMIAQAEEFKETSAALVHMDCRLTVYGYGLLPKVAEEMCKTIQEIDGLYWPVADVETRASVLRTLGDIKQFLEFVPGRKVAVQAGGNVGVWPKELSKYFDSVFTFEPDPINWECLEKNVNEGNVKAMNVALGSKAGNVGIAHDDENCGASWVIEGDGVKVITIDSLNLKACDFLQLDIEGYEFEALKGAERTIRAFSPVIVLEQKGLGDRYGASDGETAEWLKTLGYNKVHAIHRDVVYMRTN